MGENNESDAGHSCVAFEEDTLVYRDGVLVRRWRTWADPLTHNTRWGGQRRTGRAVAITPYFLAHNGLRAVSHLELEWAALPL